MDLLTCTLITTVKSAWPLDMPHFLDKGVCFRHRQSAPLSHCGGTTGSCLIPFFSLLFDEEGLSVQKRGYTLWPEAPPDTQLPVRFSLPWWLSDHIGRYPTTQDVIRLLSWFTTHVIISLSYYSCRYLPKHVVISLCQCLPTNIDISLPTSLSRYLTTGTHVVTCLPP